MGEMLGFWIVITLLALGALAFWHKMKLWTVVLIGFNLMFSTLFSIGLLEMVANIAEGAWSAAAYYWDMWVFLLLFVIFFAIFMLATKMIAKANLNFAEKTDKIAKWIVCFIVILSFSGTAGYVFYVVMPQKPRSAMPNLVTMQVLDVAAGGSLKPLLGSDVFKSTDFVKRQMQRNTAVYYQDVKNGTWKCDGSPNGN